MMSQGSSETVSEGQQFQVATRGTSPDVTQYSMYGHIIDLQR